MKRRHFFGLASLTGLSSCQKSAPVNQWKGIAMGIEVSVQYRGEVDLQPAQKAVSQAEEALTLWSANSALSRLNRTGFLENPPAALLDCLEKSRELFEASGGFFDPSIYSFLSWSKSEYEAGRTPSDEHVAQRLKLVDFSRVQISAEKVTLEPGMSLSLNAIAQGYLTDLFAENLLGTSALVNFGEYRVVGDLPWPVEVKGAAHSLGRALAVSSGSGQRLSATSAANHLIDPKTGKSPPPKEVVAVEAGEAWLADGISTIVAIGGRIPTKYPDAKVL